MLEEEKDVKDMAGDSSAQGTGDVNQEAAPSQQQEADAAQPQGESQPQGDGAVQQAEAVDEFGVPWKNRAMEYQRKTAELSESLPNIIDQALARHSEKPKEREYSISELEQFATQQPQYRAWAEEEKAKVIARNTAETIRKELQADKATQEKAQRQAAAHTYVQNTYPNLFLKDALGNVQINMQSPQVQEMAKIMQDPRIKEQPDGFAIAADIAYARISRQQTSAQTAQQARLQRDLKKAQTQNLVGAGGNQAAVAEESPFHKAKTRLAATGNMKDAQAAVTEYLKMKGVLR